MRNLKLIGLGKLLLLCLLSSSCMHDWLDTKPNKQLVVPTELKDLQAIMDNSLSMNYRATPSLFEVSADDYILTSEQWHSQSNVRNKNAYIWEADIFEGEGDDNWNTSYRRIYYANVTIEGVDKIEKTAGNEDEWNNVMGSALFFRAASYTQLVTLFGELYDKEAADELLGVPIKMESDIDVIPNRATLKENYEMIIRDLEKASSLLPIVPFIKTRPSRPASYGLLARVYLQLGDYDKSLKYADLCLNDMGGLLDYNTLDPSLSYPIPKFNEEVIFDVTMMRELLLFRLASIDPTLYDLYDDDDLRKQIFFVDDGGIIVFRGTYVGEELLFAGLSTNEIYLIRAECYARLGDDQAALRDLNELLKNRYIRPSFEPISNLDGNELLKKILVERRKELVFRGQRWKDLRRLNREKETEIVLTRIIDGKVYQLKPNDKRYVLPIPDDVIQMSGIKQNERD